MVFDAPGKTFRDDLFAEYKAHRPPMPDDLRSQIEPLLRVVRAQGSADPARRQAWRRTTSSARWRAARRKAGQVGAHLHRRQGHGAAGRRLDHAINTMSNSVLDRAGVKAKFDVFPEQIIDYLALVGDSSDNIPGIDKVGPKTAAKWLGQYSTLDSAGGRRRGGQRQGGRKPARRAARRSSCRGKLATIRTDLELPLALEQLMRNTAGRGSAARAVHDATNCARC